MAASAPGTTPIVSALDRAIASAGGRTAEVPLIRLMTNDAQLVEMPTPADLPSAAWSQTRGETSEMLTPLALFLLMMLIACTLTLLICWAYDTVGAEIEARRPRPAVLELPVHPHKRRFSAVCAALTQPPGDRRRSVVSQRGAARSLGSKRKSGPLPEQRIIRLP
jgi:hypothetical protein